MCVRHHVNAKQKFRVSGEMEASGLFGPVGVSVIRESKECDGARHRSTVNLLGHSSKGVLFNFQSDDIIRQHIF